MPLHHVVPVCSNRTADVESGGHLCAAPMQLLLDREEFCDADGLLLNDPGDLCAFDQGLTSGERSFIDVEEESGSADLLGGAGAFEGALIPGEPPLAPGPRSAPDGPYVRHQHRMTPHLNLAPFMATPSVVRLETPAVKVWRTFLSLSLRHLWVVDERNYLLGVITRKDLV